MDRFALDVAHLFAGSLVLVSFMLLYQDRMFSLLNIFALHAFVVSVSVAWQAHIQNAPHLYITAAIALIVKAILIPVVLHRIIVRLGIHRSVETVVGIGQTMLGGIGLVALSIMVMLPITAGEGTLVREDLAFALSVILLGLLMMVSRRNAVGQVIGFMSIENGLILAATGAKGMPLVANWPCRPRRCETQRLLVPSMPAQAGMEPRHSAPCGGSEAASAASVGGPL